jgi:hypothetical protein
VFEGVPVTYAARQLPLGGGAQAALLSRLLAEVGLQLGVEGAAAALRAHAALPEADAAPAAGDDAPSFTLPDGTALRLEAKPLLRASELLFEPPASAGLAATALAAAQACGPVELRKGMLEALCVSGGASAVRGFEARLVRELAAAAPSHIKPAAVTWPEYMPADAQRHAAFMGGCIVAKSAFQMNQFMSRADYQEHGPTYRRA